MNPFNNNSNQGRPNVPLFSQQSSVNTRSQTANQQPQDNPLIQSNVRQTAPVNPVNMESTRPQVSQGGANASQVGERVKPISFKELEKIFETNYRRAMQIMQRPQIKQIFATSLQYFDKSTQKAQRYERQYKNKQNFGFGVKQLREQCRNFKNDKIDQIWRVLIQTTSQICNVNQLILCEYLRLYLVEVPVYTQQFTIKQFMYGNTTRVVNAQFLQSLYNVNFQTNQISVSTQSSFFLNIMLYLTRQIYSEHVAMLNIIQILQIKDEQICRVYFRQIIKKPSCDYFTVLWKKFKQFSQIGMREQIEGTDETSKKIKQFYMMTKKFEMQKKIRQQKLTIKLKIGSSLFKVLDQYARWNQQPRLDKLINYSQAIKFIDSDLQTLVKTSIELPIKQYNYANNSLQLLLKIIPMRSLLKEDTKPNILQPRQVEALKTMIIETKSFYLEAFRFLCWFVTARRETRKEHVDQRWKRVHKNVEWMMRQEIWSQWVGVLLSQADGEQFQECEELLNQVIKISKKVVDNNVQEFWQQRTRYELELIQNFLVRSHWELKIQCFLPVLTKCITTGRIRKLFAMIGEQAVKNQILSKVIKITQYSDQHSSMGKSMLFSRISNNNQGSFIDSPQSSAMVRIETYPEQEIKFLCQLFKVAKQNLSDVQNQLFGWNFEQTDGMLTCKFLFQCLSKMREYKVPSLKCMRYIVSAIDSLFSYSRTRPAIMIALSLTFSDQSNDQSRTQLLDMINFACSKRSSSEQYRQSQKLKMAISKHLYNIVKKSRFMSEYFPVYDDFSSQSLFTRLKIQILNKNYFQVNRCFQNPQQIKYRPTPWFINILLVLQSQHLYPMDFQTIRLLIQKMQIDKNLRQQYQCMTIISQILNKGNIIQRILSNLQPALHPAKNPQTEQKKYLFGLVNNKYLQLHEFKKNLIINAHAFRQDQCVSKLIQKQRAAQSKAKQIILGNIAGSIQLLSTLLGYKNSIQNNIDHINLSTELITNLRLYKQCKKYLTQQSSIYHYKVLLPSIPSPTPTSYPNAQFTSSLQPGYLSLSQMQPPSISINIIQVLCSYLNFQQFYHIPYALYWNKLSQFTQVQISPQLFAYIDKLNQSALERVQNNLPTLNRQNMVMRQLNHEIQQYKKYVNNQLSLDENQLIIKSDYTIGIGAILRVLDQIMLSQGGSTLIYRCIINLDYGFLTQVGTTWGIQNTYDFTIFVKNIINMLQNIQLSFIQIQTIFQYLTVSVNQSYYFAREIIQGRLLPRIRQCIRVILDTCQHQKQLNTVNKISMFVLAVSEYQEYWQEDIEMFVKLPTSIVQDLLIKTEQLNHCIKKLDAKIASSSSGFESFIVQRKIGLHVLVRGTVHICVELLKTYYFIESIEQNVQFMHTLIRIGEKILVPLPKAEQQYVNLFKLNGRNMLFVDSKNQICLLQSQTAQKNISKYKSLAQFVGFLPSIQQQYGRNYQFYSAQVFAKSLYKKFKHTAQANKQVLNIYKTNFQASLQNSHQQMLSSYLSYMLIVSTTGQFGHILSNSNQDMLLINYERRQQWTFNNLGRMKSNCMQIRDIYKYRARDDLRGSLLWGHSAQQCYQSIMNLIRILIHYFEKDHQWQHNNDLIFLTCATLLQRLTQYWHIGNTFIKKYHNLLQYTLNCIQISMKISPRVYSLLLYTLVRCYTCCQAMYRISHERLQQICQIVYAAVRCNGNLYVQPQDNIMGVGVGGVGININVYNDTTICDNMFIFCNTLSRVVDHVPMTMRTMGMHEISRQNKHPIRKHTIDIIAQLTHTFISKYLSQYQNIQVNNLGVMGLVNTLLAYVYYNMGMGTNVSTNKGVDKNYTQTSNNNKDINNNTINNIIAIVSKFNRYIIKSLQIQNNSLFNCYLLQSIAMLHEYGEVYDVECANTIMEYVAKQIDTRAVRPIGDAYQLENNRNNAESRTKKKLLSAQPQRQKQYTNQIYYFSELLCYGATKSIGSNMSLSGLIQLKQLLFFLVSVCGKKIYWSNQKHSYIVESIFNGLINQQFVYRLTESSLQNTGRILRSRVPVQTTCEQNMEKVQVDQNQGQERRYFDTHRQRKPSVSQIQAKKINLFEFTVHVQVCHSIRNYIQCLLRCLQNSQSLRNFYSKILSNRFNYIDQYACQKIASSLVCIIDYLNQIMISFIRYYPYSMKKLLTLYNFMKNNTDIGYDSDFLNICMGDAGLSGFNNTNQSQQFRQFIMDIAISLCECVIQLIQIWKAADWKSNINWKQMRNKFINQIRDFLRKCQNHICMVRDQERNQRLRDVKSWIHQYCQNVSNL